VLGNLRRHSDAIESFEKAIRLQPNYPQAWNNLGISLQQTGRIAAAKNAFTQANTLQPDYPEPQQHLGLLLRKQGDMPSAIAHHRRAISLRPNYIEAYRGLSEVFMEEGNAPAAVESLRQAVSLRPTDSMVHSDLLFQLHCIPGLSREQLFAQHLAWAKCHACPLAPRSPVYRNAKDPHRRLRVGYVAADFREHTCARFIEPLLAHHDRNAFEIFCYSDVQVPDQVTARIHSHADTWRETARLSHQDLASLIRQDQIDILVDRVGHMAGSRLLAFARRPAPIQVAYRGYMDTTGLGAMDYCLTDRDRDPPGVDRYYTERLIRLPGSAQCYGATDLDVVPNGCPAEATGTFTFCSLNRPAKHNCEVIRLWAQILKRVPASKLMMLGSLNPAGPRQVKDLFAIEGVNSDRIYFVRPRPRREYLKCFHQADLVLDPFPYNGHTTSLDALWMGVPVVTFPQDTCISRIGVSINRALNLQRFIAGSADQYVQLAVELAGDANTRAELRRSLRQRLQSSPLMDAPSHAAQVETAFGQMWRNWLQTQL
jgi:predicted O-linked N-acetylglucosamine transferase (SPINDLY family)